MNLISIFRCSSSLTARVLSPDNPHKVSQHSHQVNTASYQCQNTGLCPLIGHYVIILASDRLMFAGDRPGDGRRIADAGRGPVSPPRVRDPGLAWCHHPSVRGNPVINVTMSTEKKIVS